MEEKSELTFLHGCEITRLSLTAFFLQQPSSSGLLLYSTPFKSLDPAHHDSGIWSEALRIASHLFTASPSGELEDRTPSILLESYRLARNRGNLKLAMFLLQRHILELSCEDISEELNLSDLLEQMNASEDVTPIEKLQVTRELAKLNACRGQPAVGIDLLSGSVVKYSCNVENGAKTATGSLGTPSEFTARSLLTIVKWLQADSRLMQSVWSVEHDAGRKLQMLLTDEYTFRKSRLGLYQSASSSESHELFRPDESVAKFDKHEYSIGQLLHLATIQCPDLAKAWWSLAGWCYRIGRKNLEALRCVWHLSGCTHDYFDRLLLVKRMGPYIHIAVFFSISCFHAYTESGQTLRMGIHWGWAYAESGQTLGVDIH